MNTRFGPDVSSAIASMGEGLPVLDRKGHPMEETLSDEGMKLGSFFADPGDFGIEPCLYIFGPSPLDVVHKAYELEKAIVFTKRRDEN
jgi:predicted fused transcriptional regulator/phosphomethylpyrimidine kinase